MDKPTQEKHSVLKQWLLDKDSRLPAVNIIHNNLLRELVVAELGKNLGPNQPIHSASEEDAEANNTMDPVGKTFVDVLAMLGRHKGRDDKINVAQHKEDGDGESGLDWGVPVPGFAVEVEMHKASGDKCIDDCEGVRNQTITF